MTEYKALGTFRKITLERRFFTTLSDGSHEFDWILSELGVPEEDRPFIEAIDTTCDTDGYFVED